jgi:hypothetical protein
MRLLYPPPQFRLRSRLSERDARKACKEMSAKVPTYKPPPASISNTPEDNRSAHRRQMVDARFLSPISTADPAGKWFPSSSFPRLVSRSRRPSDAALAMLSSFLNRLVKAVKSVSLARKVLVNLLAHSYFVVKAGLMFRWVDGSPWSDVPKVQDR